jgi:pyruvate ferredoxin oxidoreductase delta subunit
MYCPDMAIKVKDGKREAFDYDYCKGCGICARECPGKKGQKAIIMVEEGK